MDRSFLINAPSVVSEIIDGEVIIMNLKSGSYYSSEHIGAVIWSWIESGKTEDEMNRIAVARYDAPPLTISHDLAAFVGQLLDGGLVREVAAPHGGAALNGDDAGPRADKEVFVTPVLCTYTDMRDLLLLDPIHDVDSVGWPKPKESEAG